MNYIESFFGAITMLTWGWAVIPLLVVLGVLFTLVSNFVQIKYFTRMFHVLFSSKPTEIKGRISPLQALLVSIGGRVGAGNIAGVAVAITLGGPGAVFWMWVMALVGMATSLFECTLAQVYKRSESDGSYRGGPAHYIIHGLDQNFKFLAFIYSVCLIAFVFAAIAFQGNTVAGSLLDSVGVDRIVTGIFLAVVTGLVIYGGIKRIAKAADFIVPIMAISYLLLALFIIITNVNEVPTVLMSIVKNALGIEEAVGGGIGIAITQGIQRGLFSNEAGLGTAPNVAASCYVRHPVSQGITQSLSVFIDTIIICTCTALVILLGDVYIPGAEGIDGVLLTQQTLVSHVGEWSKYYLSITILLFSFSSVIFGYYISETALTIFTNSPLSKHLLKALVIVVIFIGATAPGATSVFFFGDPVMGVLALVNLLVLAMLFPVAMRVLKDYNRQIKNGIELPIFDAKNFDDLDIDHSVWNVKK